MMPKVEPHNPFDKKSDPDRHAIWERLIRVDAEAFVAADWKRVEEDFDAANFEGIRCGGSGNPERWEIVFPTLNDYRDSWLAASQQFTAHPFAEGITPRDAIFMRMHLSRIEIHGDRAICRKKFYGSVPLRDGTALDATRQTLFRLHRRTDSPWGWLIVGFLGNLPLILGDDLEE
jgi:hypothetical protein